MNTRQILLVRSSFRSVQMFDDVVAHLFYNRLFKSEPNLRHLFRGNLREQGLKLVHTLSLVVNSLEDLNPLRQTVQKLGRQHSGYGVADEDYDKVAEALMWTFRQVLGSEFTDETEEAWLTAYNLVADTMKAASHVEIETGMDVM